MQTSAPKASSRFLVPGAWISAILLAAMLLNLAMSITSADWTAGLGVLGIIVLGGFLFGLAMSYSHWSGLFPLIQSFVVGLVWVLIWVGRTPEIPDGVVGAERIVVIGQNLWSWFMLLFGESPARSNLVFTLELAVLMWWLGYLSAWAVFREGRVWRAIIPIGLVLIVNVYFGPANLGFHLAIFIVCALLLAVRSNLSEQEINWRIEGIRYPSDIQFDFLRDGLIFAIVIMLLAFFLPNAGGNGALASAVNPLREPWYDIQQEWGRIFSTLNYQGGTAGVAAFGDTLTLGGERNLGNTPIMDIRSKAGRYWRAVAYDTFTGRRWLNTGTLIQSIDAANNVITPQFSKREEITHTVTVLAPTGNVLFAASQPLRVSLRAEADLKVIERNVDGDLPLAEIAMLRRAGPPLEMGNTYQVVSSLSDATIEDLQSAGTDYPAWVSDLYLNLPDDMSPRVGELAKEVTAGAETPYDQVVAIESYLRNFTYDDQIPAPPPGVDAVDYFLFDVQAGYCDYYASSLAMMARSLGIPARVSAGYSQGEYMEQADVYRVREYNAHSWPEVFFPGYGWVEFEPTASEVEIVRRSREDEQPFLAPGATPTLDRLLEEEQFGENPELGEGDGQLPDTGPSTVPVSSNWWIGLVLMLVVVAAGAVVMLRSGSRRSRTDQVRQDPQFASKLFGKLVQWAQRLRLPLLPSQTPHEQAALLVRAAPEGRNAIMSITDLYVEDLFSPYEIDERNAANAASSWDGLQKLFRREWMRGWFKPLDDMRDRMRRKPAEQPDDDD
ncbi:MAG: DUF4129 domain-containing protein [Anaerolineae bacterium]|nr:DUF4129 domain-containing protein [Anaerolineae bacterium]